MKPLYEEVFAISKAALYGTEHKISGDLDYTELYKTILKSKLVPITFKVVNSPENAEVVSEPILTIWKRETMSRAVRQMYIASEIKKILATAEERGIQLVLFKGLAVAALYYDPNLRTTSDADMLVDSDRMQDAISMLEELGFESVEDGAKEHVPVFVKKGKMPVKVELHDCLWEDYEGKQAEILDSLELTKKDTLIKQSCIGINFTTLGIDEHFIFQIYHIVKHLFFEGISLRYFTDITLYVNKYFDEMNWPSIREKLRLLHYERFLDCIVIMCQRYLGMREDVPGVEPVTEEMLDHLIEDVLGEKEAVSEKDAWETINFLDRYFMRNTVVKESKFQQKRKQILPLPSELNEKYSYAKKCPILLPVAWVHRVIYFINYKRDCKKYGKDAEGAIKKSQSRLDLMRELAIMDTDKEQKKKGK